MIEEATLLELRDLEPRDAISRIETLSAPGWPGDGDDGGRAGRASRAVLGLGGAVTAGAGAGLWVLTPSHPWAFVLGDLFAFGLAYFALLLVAAGYGAVLGGRPTDHPGWPV